MVDQSGSLTLGNGAGPQGGAGKALSANRHYLATVCVVYLYSLFLPAMINLGSVALSGPRIVLLIMFVPMLADLFSGRLGKIYPVDWLLFAFIGWATISTAKNNPEIVIQSIGSTSIEFIGGYLMGRVYVRTPEAFAAMIRVGFIMILITLPFGLVEMKTGVAFWPKVFRGLPLFMAWEDVANPTRGGLERAQVFFSHPIHQGLFCSMFFSLVFVGLRGAASLVKRIIMTAAVVVGTVMALSSAPLLSTMLQIGLISWAFIFRKHPGRWWYLLGLFALMYVTIDMLSNRTPSKVLMTYATFSPQTAYYRAIINEWAIYNIWQNPFLGLGFRDWVRPDYMLRGSVDNFWLLTAMRYGIPALLILGIAYADAVFRVGLAKTTAGTRADNMRLAWTITFAGLSFVLYTVHVWTSIYSFTFFLLGAGLWIPGWVRDQAAVNTAPESQAAPQPDLDAPRGGILYSRPGIAAQLNRSRAEDPAPERDAGLLRSRYEGETSPEAGFSRTAEEGSQRATPESDSAMNFSRYENTVRPRKTDDGPKRKG
ncbi:MAG: O-antigen ligase family protein [Rhodobacteraceae bacterium]|nr:O-antigen ligase family protein [Paracoccaceae bacterium]